MAWFVPALLAGLKAAGLGAATAIGGGLGSSLIGGNQSQAPMLPMQGSGFANNTIESTTEQGVNPLIGGMNALTAPGLGMNFMNAFLGEMKKKKYPTSGDTQRNQKIINEGIKYG